jgi:hypothetical protein
VIRRISGSPDSGRRARRSQKWRISGPPRGAISASGSRRLMAASSSSAASCQITASATIARSSRQARSRASAPRRPAPSSSS